MTDLLSRLLADRSYLVADGATGTNLFAMGLQTGDCPELWAVDHPDRVAANHRGFIAAGSDIILTNSFGGTANRLRLHAADGRVHELNAAAASIARAEADKAGRPVVVAGSMGPTGDLYQPLGPLTVAEATEAYADQARALKAGGADIAWIETVSSRDEAGAALAGAAAAGLPAVCTMTFETNGRTMMGLQPGDALAFARDQAAAPLAFGANCGNGAPDLVTTILDLHGVATAQDIIIAKGNCGIPSWQDGRICYSGTPEIMAAYARLARDAGARIIGGCCGATPVHVRAMVEALARHQPAAVPPTVGQVVAALGPLSYERAATPAAGTTDGAVDGGAASGRRRGRRRSA